MKKLIKIIKSLRLRQVLTVFLAGCLLSISTACNQGTVAQAEENAAQAGGREYTETAKRAGSNTYDDFDSELPFKGGINGYDDDRRYDSETAAKTQTLIDTAERRKADNLGEYTDNVLERSVLNPDVDEKATDAFTDKLERNKDKAVDYIDKKSDKLGRNLERLPGVTKEVVEAAVDTGEDASRPTKNAKENIRDNFEDLN